MWFRVRVSHPPNHVNHWSCDHMILKKALSPLSLNQWPPILLRSDLSWVEHNHRVTWLIYHVITLHSQKGTFHWPPNLVGLRVRVKQPHLLFQVTYRSSDHVLFKKRHPSTNARPEYSAGDIKLGKTHKSKVCFVIQKILTFDSHWYTPL